MTKRVEVSLQRRGFLQGLLSGFGARYWRILQHMIDHTMTRFVLFAVSPLALRAVGKGGGAGALH